MKKIYALSLLSKMTIGALNAHSDITLREIQQMASEGKAKRLPPQLLKGFNSNSTNSIPVAKIGNTSNLSILDPEKVSSKAFTPKNSPQRVTAAGADIYASLYYSTDFSYVPGLYELTPEGSELIWSDPVYASYYMQPINGWLRDDKVAGLSMYLAWGYVYGYYYYETDFATGELLTYNSYEHWTLPSMFYLCTLDTDTETIYGYALDSNTGGIFWASSSLSSPEVVEEITPADSDFCYSLCYNELDSYFYGININQEFVKIDKSGNQTVIANVPDAELCSTNFTGLIWSPVAGVYYWGSVHNEADNLASYLYTITPDGNFEIIQSYPNSEQFTYFLTTDENIISGQPAEVIIDNVDFVDASLNGTVTFKIPTKFSDGEPISSTLDYTALLDGEPYKTGIADPGEILEIEYTVNNSGFHTFGMYVTVNDINSRTASTQTYIGYDIPTTPKNVTLTTTEVVWIPVTTSVNGAYFDASAVTYEVFLNGISLGTTTETSFPVSIAEDGPLDIYIASVVAECNGEKSAPGISESMVAGEACTVPLSLTPTQDEFTYLMSIFNVNNSDLTWRWYKDTYDTEYVWVGMSYAENLDSYLFLPPVKITDIESYYKFTLDTGSLGGFYEAAWIEVVYATSPDPEGVVGTIIAPHVPSRYILDGGEWEPLEGLVEFPETGNYYIGIRSTSDPTHTGVAARNFSLTTSNVSKNSPASVSDIKASAASQGVLEAYVTFTFPTKTLGGTTMPADTDLRAVFTVNDKPIETTLQGKPGDTGNVTIETVQGMNTISVAIENGEMSSPKAATEVYTGVSIPAAPQNLVVHENETMLGAYLSWDPVTTSEEEGGYVDPTSITYNVLQLMSFLGLEYWAPVVEGISATENQIVLQDEETPQAQYILGVSATNAAGTSTNVATNFAILGTPYKLPFLERFEDPENVYSTSPWLTYNKINGITYSGAWEINMLSNIDPAFNGDDQYVVVGYTYGDPCQGAIGLPRFSTANCDEVVFTFDMLTGRATAPVTLYGQIYGSEELITIAKFDYTDSDTEFTNVSCSLPSELLDKDWVQIYVVAEYATPNDICAFSNIDIMSETSHIMIVKSESSINAGKNTISLRGFEGQQVLITTLDGKVIVNSLLETNDATYMVEKGIYTVKAGDQMSKVLVR